MFHTKENSPSACPGSSRSLSVGGKGSSQTSTVRHSSSVTRHESRCCCSCSTSRAVPMKTSSCLRSPWSEDHSTPSATAADTSSGEESDSQCPPPDSWKSPPACDQINISVCREASQKKPFERRILGMWMPSRTSAASSMLR